MKKVKVTGFIPLGVVDAHGDMISKDCKFTIAPHIKILESHRSEDGLRIITEIEMDEVSMVPKMFGFNSF